MINFKKMWGLSALICFSATTFAAPSPADISICKSYLSALASNTPLSDGQKQQANTALQNCLSTNQGGCTNFPNSPNCANVKSKIDLLGQAISTPAAQPIAAAPSSAPKSAPIQPTAVTPPPLPSSPPANAYPAPQQNNNSNPTTPTNKNSNPSNEPYSYF